MFDVIIMLIISDVNLISKVFFEKGGKTEIKGVSLSFDLQFNIFDYERI